MNLSLMLSRLSVRGEVSTAVIGTGDVAGWAVFDSYVCIKSLLVLVSLHAVGMGAHVRFHIVCFPRARHGQVVDGVGMERVVYGFAEDMEESGEFGGSNTASEAKMVNWDRKVKWKEMIALELKVKEQLMTNSNSGGHWGKSECADGNVNGERERERELDASSTSWHVNMEKNLRWPNLSFLEP